MMLDYMSLDKTPSNLLFSFSEYALFMLVRLLSSPES